MRLVKVSDSVAVDADAVVGLFESYYEGSELWKTTVQIRNGHETFFMVTGRLDEVMAKLAPPRPAPWRPAEGYPRQRSTWVPPEDDETQAIPKP